MQMVGSNLMGVDARDFEVAHEFLKKSRTFSKNEKDFEESPQDFLGEKQNNLEGISSKFSINQHIPLCANFYRYIIDEKLSDYFVLYQSQNLLLLSWETICSF